MKWNWDGHEYDVISVEMHPESADLRLVHVDQGGPFTVYGREAPPHDVSPEAFAQTTEGAELMSAAFLAGYQASEADRNESYEIGWQETSEATILERFGDWRAAL